MLSLIGSATCTGLVALFVVSSFVPSFEMNCGSLRTRLRVPFGLYCLRLILPLWWSTETIRKWIKKKLLSVGGYSTLSFDISYLSCTPPCCCCPKIVELC
ncbi:hypothetical protein V6N13_099931 [Hibiscus sabdariffa]